MKQTEANDNGHGPVEQPAMQMSDVANNRQAQQVMALLMSLMRDLLAVDDQASDLPLRQLRVCAMLYEGSRSMSSLSRELGVSLSAMTQIADRLERARLVKRAFEGTDRRVRSLQLTPRAQRIMQLRDNSRVERASVALEQLAPQQRTNVLMTLQALQSACSATKSNGAASVSTASISTASISTASISTASISTASISTASIGAASIGAASKKPNSNGTASNHSGKSTGNGSYRKNASGHASNGNGSGGSH